MAKPPQIHCARPPGGAVWASHNLLHLRQLSEIEWAYQPSQTAPYTPTYAGDW